MQKKIKDKILKHGSITVEKFIETALFDKDSGYYIKKQPIGKDGDFITAPEISQLFGEMIGLFLINWIHLNLQNSEFEIIELGAGKGTLAKDVLNVFLKFPDLYKNLKYNIVDVNEKLLEIQQDNLKTYSKKISWFKNLKDIKINKPTLIIANEFFDVFPVRQFQFLSGKWHERIVKFNGTDFYFSTGDIANDEFLKNLIPPHEGAIKEYAPEVEKTSRDIAEILQKNSGLFITFDYGEYGFFGSSLQSLFRNKNNKIFENIGNADLTCYVDFELVDNIFKSSNLQTYFLTQRDFLISLGIEKRAEMLAKTKDSSTKMAIEQSLDRLISENQMGVLFKCLIAEKLPKK